MSKGKKRLIIFFLLFSVALTLMSYQHNGQSFSFLDILSYPYNVFSRATSNFGSTIDEVRNTYEENKKLKRELNQLLIERQRYREIIQENSRLRDLLSLKGREPRYVATAKVISRGYDRLLNTEILDKGRTSGIEKGMAVITAKGLVGKVYSVRDDFADVLLLEDANFSVAVRLQGSRHEGIVSGTGYGACVLKYIPPEETVAKGEVVVTSGFDGIFPEGLPVGVVSSVKKEGIEFFQHVEVLPFQSPDKIEEVVVLKKP